VSFPVLKALDVLRLVLSELLSLYLIAKLAAFSAAVTGFMQKFRT
jgi:hypothetical protein